MRHLSLLQAICVLGLTVIFAGDSSAATKRVKSSKKNRAAVANIQLEHQLEAIRATLNKADHDYQGHRAAAVEQLTHAIHHLQHGKHHPNPSHHFTKGKHSLPQSQSDAILKQAITSLQSLTVPAGKHQAQVQGNITKAIADLRQALKAA